MNASHVYGGAKLEAQTLGNAVGVQVPYAIDTNFPGFISMVDDMGGLDVNVPEAMHDANSGADFAAGPEPSRTATRRSRSPGTGTSSRPVTSSAPRTRRYLIISALAQLRAQNTGPVDTLKLLGNLGRHAQLDGIGVDDLYNLGRLGLSIDPANVRNVVVPIGSGSGTRLSLGCRCPLALRRLRRRRGAADPLVRP